MAQLSEYQRVDSLKTSSQQDSTDSTGGKNVATRDHSRHIRWTVVVLTIFVAVLSTIITSITSAKLTTPMTSTLIPVIAFGVLMLCVLVVNPLLRLIGGGRLMRQLSRAELVCIFAALAVTSGIGTFGLVDQLIPIIPGPFNPDWATPQSGWEDQYLPYLNKQLYITDAEMIRDYREGITQLPAQDEPMAKHLEAYRETIGRIPWGAWIGPLSRWMVFVFGCYGVFYCLAYVVLPYWSGREKLIFPLAKLPEALLPEEGDNGWLPSILRSPLFWMGFALSFLLLSYNGAANGDIIPLSPVKLGINANAFGGIVGDSVFAGLSGGARGMRWLIFFTAIGIAYLLPLNISFSIWFYFLVGRGLLLVMVWMGYGQRYSDFPDEWIWAQHASSAMGAGGFLLFSAVLLYRCVREYFVLCRKVAPARRLRMLTPVIGLAVCMGIVTVFIAMNGVPLLWAAVFTLFITLITLGLMRMTAEGGVFWYQVHASFFHFFKMAALGKFVSTKILAPLMPIYGVFFLDVKTFIAPNIVNAAKMHEDVGGSRLKYHLTVILSVVLSVAAGLITAICIAYIFGANVMSNWFYTSYPKYISEKAAAATTMTPDVDGALIGWWSFGAAWTALSLFLRQSMFWFPHPIGFVMLINPLMNSMWFSFFIGWVVKKLVVTYGGKQTFDVVRKPMIGLILGELIAVLIWIIFGVIEGTNYGVTLNRYGS